MKKLLLFLGTTLSFANAVEFLGTFNGSPKDYLPDYEIVYAFKEATIKHRNDLFRYYGKHPKDFDSFVSPIEDYLRGVEDLTVFYCSKMGYNYWGIGDLRIIVLHSSQAGFVVSINSTPFCARKKK